MGEFGLGGGDADEAAVVSEMVGIVLAWIEMPVLGLESSVSEDP
jgi:hypothetical protein